MDSLIDCGTTTDDFFRDILMPLAIYGFGSVDSILNMKRYEIVEMSLMASDESIQNKILAMHGLPKI